MRDNGGDIGQLIINFMDWAGMTNFEIEETVEAFDKANDRYLDFIEAHGGCTKVSGQTYKTAIMKASEVRNITFLGELEQGTPPQEAEFMAYEAYTQVMTALFFQKFIQLRWRRFKDFKKLTGRMNFILYREYLDAMMVVSYMEYSFAAENLGLLKVK